MNLKLPRVPLWPTTVAATLGAGVLLAISLGVPNVGGCGGVPDELVDGVADDALTRLNVPLKVALIWDVPGSEGAAYKLGEVALTKGGFKINLPSAPPDEVLVDGAVGVAHFVALPAGKVIADGPLSRDDADLLTQGALGSSGASAVVFRAGDSDRYPWLDSFPPGASCARGERVAPNARAANGSVALAGFVSVSCKGLKLSAGAVEDAPFTEWAIPVAEARGRP